ncbi:hypothetical protein BKA70DRAFT_1346315 [Coprinopsis sp. MPI-PUGE-AT-0042]|nr:hypothetical protein BKA70DRAFT_1346315 [Coprinopsis sp. MPI-PUGE-AT-0042]
MVHSTKLHTVNNTETPGDAFSEKLRADLSALLLTVLDQAGVGPVVLWGEWAMLYYGVPVAANDLHILVPDEELEIAHTALLSAGYKDEPAEIHEHHGLLDPNIRWEELGCPARRFVNAKLHYERALLPIVVQNYSSTANIFTKASAASFDKCGGLAIPPLHVLGQSFLRAMFKLRRSEATSRAESVVQWWVASVKDTGYTPLGSGAMKGVEGIDEEMELFWERGY